MGLVIVVTIIMVLVLVLVSVVCCPAPWVVPCPLTCGYSSRYARHPTLNLFGLLNKKGEDYVE